MKVRRKIMLLVLIAVIVGLTNGLAISRGWDRKKAGEFRLSGINPGIYSASCCFSIYLSQERANPENKDVKIYVKAIEHGWSGEEIHFEISMDLEEWEYWVEDINRIDERLHEYAEKGIIED